MAELRRKAILQRWVVITAQPWKALAEVLLRRRGSFAAGPEVPAILGARLPANLLDPLHARVIG